MFKTAFLYLFIMQFSLPNIHAFPLRGFVAPGKLSSGQFSAENGRQPRQVAEGRMRSKAFP